MPAVPHYTIVLNKSFVFLTVRVFSYFNNKHKQIFLLDFRAPPSPVACVLVPFRNHCQKLRLRQLKQSVRQTAMNDISVLQSTKPQASPAVTVLLPV